MIFAILFLAGIMIMADGSPRQIFAATADQIRQNILDANKKIEDLQKEIDQYSSLLNANTQQAQTLKNALAALELNRKKLTADLALTTSKITKTTLTLDELADSIAETEIGIEKSAEAVAQGVRSMGAAEDQSLMEELLNQRSISEAWDYVNALRTIQGRVSASLSDLKTSKEKLEAQKAQAELQRVDLVKLQKNLSGQKEVVEYNKTEKSKILTETQNSAAAYQAQLNEKIALREQYEKTLFDYESQLQITLDPNSIPSARSGVLSWPLKSVYVTQYFGKTVSAKRLYVSGTHGGMDLRAAVGTPVMAALTGTVVDTEGVKVKNGCQYGKWVLIRHANGLSTIYGHLSVVSVSPGDTVVTGDSIGYSGSTGFSTGPHLHFGVYASSAVKIVDSSSIGSSNCRGIKTVAAPPAGYLDPSAYLPKI